MERSFFPENERNDQERSHRSEKKTNAQNAFLKILERLVKERNGTGSAFIKERLKSLTRSCFQERVLRWERILNRECVSSSDFLCM